MFLEAFRAKLTISLGPRKSEVPVVVVPKRSMSDAPIKWIDPVGMIGVEGGAMPPPAEDSFERLSRAAGGGVGRLRIRPTPGTGVRRARESAMARGSRGGRGCERARREPNRASEPRHGDKPTRGRAFADRVTFNRVTAM